MAAGFPLISRHAVNPPWTLDKIIPDFQGLKLSVKPSTPVRLIVSSNFVCLVQKRINVWEGKRGKSEKFQLYEDMDVVVQAHRDILQRVGIFRLATLYTLKLKRQAWQMEQKA